MYQIKAATTVLDSLQTSLQLNALNPKTTISKLSNSKLKTELKIRISQFSQPVVKAYFYLTPLKIRQIHSIIDSLERH